MNDEKNKSPLKFPIILDPFSGYSYRKYAVDYGKTHDQQNFANEETNSSEMLENKTFTHPLGKKPPNICQ